MRIVFKNGKKYVVLRVGMFTWVVPFGNKGKKNKGGR